MSTANETVHDAMSTPAPRKPGGWRPLAGRRWEAADTVIAFASALVFVIFAVFLALCIQGYQQTLDGARARAQTTAEVVASQAAWLLGGGFAALRLIDSKDRKSVV